MIAIKLQELLSKFSSNKNLKDLNNLEYILMSWLESGEFISSELNHDEISLGLNQYLDNDTYKFWLHFLTAQNSVVYASMIENDLVKQMLQESIQEFDSCPAKLNLKINSLQVLDLKFAPIFKALKTQFTIDLVIKNLIEFDLKEDITYDVSIQKESGMFIIKLKQDIVNISNEFFLTNMNVIKNSIAISMVALSLTSIDAFAQSDYNSSDAVKMGTKALIKTEAIQEMIERTKVTGQRKVRNFQDDNPEAKTPVAIIGYGAKIAHDKGVSYKGKNNHVIHDLSYKVTIGKEMKIDLSTPTTEFINNSNVGLSGTPSEVKMNFDITW